MIPLNVGILTALVSPPPLNARQGVIISAIGPQMQGHLEQYEINTPLRICHFLSQIAHESDSFNTCREYATGGAYEGRADLGNTQPGDGPRYKGRGLMQITGRANYERLGNELGMDLINFPERAEEPVVALLIACQYWKDHKINAMADRDDLYAVTRAINGGLNGINQRRAFLIKAKAVIQRQAATTVAPSISSDQPTLYRGVKLPQQIANLQETLAFLGWPVATDGDFGAGTETAVKGFQVANGLKGDGIVGPATWAVILKGVLKKTGATGAGATA